jgi:hypothetical protein
MAPFRKLLRPSFFYLHLQLTLSAGADLPRNFTKTWAFAEKPTPQSPAHAVIVLQLCSSVPCFS